MLRVRLEAVEGIQGIISNPYSGKALQAYFLRKAKKSGLSKDFIFTKGQIFPNSHKVSIKIGQGKFIVMKMYSNAQLDVRFTPLGNNRRWVEMDYHDLYRQLYLKGEKKMAKICKMWQQAYIILSWKASSYLVAKDI